MHPENGWSLEPRAWLFRPVLAEVGAKFWLYVAGRPLAAVDEKRLGPSFAVQRARSHYRYGEHPGRRIARPGVHDVAPDAALGPEKLFVIARSGHGVVLQVHGFDSSAARFGVPDVDLPPPRLPGRGAHAVDAAARSGDQCDGDSLLF